MGEQLRIERIKKGLTQSELSKLSGVSRQTISNLENESNYSVSVTTLNKLSKALSVPIDIFFKDSVKCN